MRRTTLMALLCSLAVCTTAFAGSITGTITFDGKGPPPRRIKMDADPDCAKKHSEAVYSERLVLGEGNTVGNIFVSIKNPPAGNHAAPSEAVVIDQKGCVYQPHVVGVMAGQPLQFKNSDGILHNVHGLPKVNREFNIGMPPTLKERDQVLNKPEPAFKVKCDVHPWMNSYVAVMDHPYRLELETVVRADVDDDEIPLRVDRDDGAVGAGKVLQVPFFNDPGNFTLPEFFFIRRLQEFFLKLGNDPTADIDASAIHTIPVELPD